MQEHENFSAPTSLLATSVFKITYWGGALSKSRRTKVVEDHGAWAKCLGQVVIRRLTTFSIRQMLSASFWKNSRCLRNAPLPPTRSEVLNWPVLRRTFLFFPERATKGRRYNAGTSKIPHTEGGGVADSERCAPDK